MPVSANDLIKKLMAKAGVSYDGDLAAIPDDIASSVDNSLLTISAATNNHPEVKKVYFAQAYNGLDAEINGLITEFALSDEIKTEIERAGGSTKKAVALARKIKEVSEKGSPDDKAAAKKLSDQIVELNGKLAAEIQKQTSLKTEYDNQLQQIKIKTKLGSIVNGYKTMFDELDPQAKEAAIDALLNKALQDSDAEFKFDDKGSLSLIKKDGSNLFGDNHTLVTPQSFIDKSLSKILKVTDPNAGKNTPAPPIPGQRQDQPNPNIAAAVKESLDAYKQATNGQSVTV